MEKNKSVYKISCEYYIYANSKEEAIEFIANEDDLIESHFLIEKVKEDNIDENDIYNNENETTI